MIGVLSLSGLTGGSGGGGVDTSAFVTETFLYDGVNNIFDLSDTASKILMVYIDQGAFPDQIPVASGPYNSVEVQAVLLVPGNRVTITYIK